VNNVSTQNKQSGIMFHNGKKYAVGLMWLTATSDDAKTLVRERAKKAKADYYCIRSGAATQHGLGSLKKGHRVNQSVAAAMVADVLVGDWHGVFRTDNGWWYVKVHSDVIAPDGDVFFESEEDAYNHFMTNHEGRVWAHAYAPVEWDVPNITKHLTLEEVLDNIPAPRLIAANMDAQFGGTKNKNVAIITFLLVVTLSLAVLLGPTLWRIAFPAPPVKVQRPVTQKTKKPETTLQLPGELNELPTLQAPDPDVFKAIKPSAFVLACGETSAQLVKAIAGWSLVGIECNSKAVQVKWQENKGTLNNVREAVGDLLQKGASMNLNKKDLTLSLPLPTLPDYEQNNFLNTASAVLLLESRFLNVGGLKIEPVTPPPPPPPTDYQKRKGLIPKQQPPYLNIAVSSNLSPKVLGNYFDVKGLQLLSIQWDFPSSVWVYEAKMIVDDKKQ